MSNVLDLAWTSTMNEYFSAAETFVIRFGALALLAILIYKLIRKEMG